MTLFLALLPLYLFGNLHCLGMCGPLVAMIGHHRYRDYYFLGRTLSFAVAGWIAGLFGAVLHAVLAQFHVAALTSFLFGGIIICVAVASLMGWKSSINQWLSGMTAPINQTVAMLMLKDRRWPTLLFGLATILLPCGQTVIVYSACALEGDPWAGLLNGGAFALLTSPSLVLAMHATRWLGGIKRYYNVFLGVGGIAIGVLAICRGMADMQVIPHLVFMSASDPRYHIALY